MLDDPLTWATPAQREALLTMRAEYLHRRDTDEYPAVPALPVTAQAWLAAEQARMRALTLLTVADLPLLTASGVAAYQAWRRDALARIRRAYGAAGAERRRRLDVLARARRIDLASTWIVPASGWAPPDSDTLLKFLAELVTAAIGLPIVAYTGDANVLWVPDADGPHTFSVTLVEGEDDDE